MLFLWTLKGLVLKKTNENNFISEINIFFIIILFPWGILDIFMF